MDEDLIYLNGIDGVTGNYLVPPLAPTEAAALARGQPTAETSSWYLRIWNTLRSSLRGLPPGLSPTDVRMAGWAVVFAQDVTPEVRASLEPLIAHRRARVAPDRIKVLEHRPGETMKAWLKRHGVAPGSVAPAKVPYYILLVGSPASLAFEFQYLLDIEYAVGRLAFDRVEQYQRYVQSVIAYENGELPANRREVVFWGTRHAADRATQLSADHLIAPLALGVPAQGSNAAEPPIAASHGFASHCLRGPEATKAALLEVLHRTTETPPAVLFTASHGMGFPKGHASQTRAQGSLLCQDWSGLGTIQPGQYLTADDIADHARLHGLIAFLFACYGIGCPASDSFLLKRNQGPSAIADQPFVAALPQRLLSHPAGGALAVVGHVDRAWGYSIRPQGLGPQLDKFRNFLTRILLGEPVGHATKDFSDRYAVLSAELLGALDTTQPGSKPNDAELAWAWIERNDAQNYVVLGDPAVSISAS